MAKKNDDDDDEYDLINRCFEGMRLNHWAPSVCRLRFFVHGLSSFRVLSVRYFLIYFFFMSVIIIHASFMWLGDFYLFHFIFILFVHLLSKRVTFHYIMYKLELQKCFSFFLLSAPEKKFEVYQKRVNNDTIRVTCMVSGVYPVPRLTLFNNSVTDKQ